MPLSVDASNSCIPPTQNLTALTPPLPTVTRGEPVILDGTGGRLNSDLPLLVYGSGRLVVVRELQSVIGGEEEKGDGGEVAAFVYRGHTAQVTCAKFSPSGCYVASGDARGKLRIWSYDNPSHLCKLELPAALSGPIHDISWSFDSQRIAIVGQGSKSDPSSLCTRVIQWDTGVKIGDLAQHARKSGRTCAFKPSRPMRIVTGGGEDSRCLFNAGPPFARVVDGKPVEDGHVRGSVNCVRYNSDGTMIVSVGTDKSVCFYDGKTMELLERMESVHGGSIYSCAWNKKGDEVITCSADGKVHLISVDGFRVVYTWDVSTAMVGNSNSGTGGIPMGAMLMGCAFVEGDVPIAIALNGKIVILPKSSDTSGTIKFLCGHQSPISSYAIDYGSKTMYTGDSDGVICMWDIQSGAAIDNVQCNGEGDDSLDSTFMNKCHKGAITGMTFVDGQLMSIGWDDKIRSTKGNTMESSIKLPSQPNQMSKGTNLVVIATVNGLLLVKGGTVVSELIETPYEPTSVFVSLDDSTVYVGGNDCQIHIYSVSDETLQNIETLTDSHRKPIYALALSNDGTKLASADDRDICIFSISSDGKYDAVIKKGRWCFHQQRINSLTWSNGDHVLASGGNDDSIYLWSLDDTMKRIHYSYTHRGGVTGLEFLREEKDRMVLVSVGNDACVNQWDLTEEVKKKFG